MQKLLAIVSYQRVYCYLVSFAHPARQDMLSSLLFSFGTIQLSQFLARKGSLLIPVFDYPHLSSIHLLCEVSQGAKVGVRSGAVRKLELALLLERDNFNTKIPKSPKE